jgi:hypothetical protein
VSVIVFGIRALITSTVAMALLAGCGHSAETAAPVAPPIAAKPDVIITLDGERHTCVVALLSEAQGSAVACNEVVAFVRDELRVASGSIYEIRTIADVDRAEMTRVRASLDGAGYRFSGGPHDKP